MKEPIRIVTDASASADLAPTNFEAFVEDHHARLFGALCLVTGDRFEAEEIMQDAFVRVFERWDRVREMESPAGYLFMTAMNVFRKRRRRAALALRRAVGVAPEADAFEAVEAREVVFQGLARVSADQRAALVATALFGFNSEEAARLLGVSAQTVRARASRARSAMRAAMGEER